MPGTGKTASVKQAVKRLYQDGLDFDFVEINGMRLSNPNHVYSVLWKNLVSFGACQLQKVKENKRCSWGSALERLKNFFSIDAQSLAEDVDPVRRKPLVLLLDEFDTLISKKKSNTIYHFFEWIGWPNSQLILIAVANTMDLPERLMSNRIVSRMGSRRLNFLPYTYPQLEEVIKYSLSKEYVDLFNRHALEFCARKVSSVSGDARRALNLARRAIDIALKMQEKKNIVMQSKSNQSTGITDIISLSMIEEALRLGFVGGCIETIADLSLQEKIHLLAILLCSRSKILCTPVIIKDGDADLDSPKYDAVNNGLYPDIFPTFGSVCDVHLQLLRTNQSNIHAEIPKSMKANITFSQMQNIFTHLESLNLVNRLISSPHSDYETVDAASQVRLCVSEAEMQRALSSVDIFKRHFV